MPIILKKLYIYKLVRPLLQQSFGSITHFLTQEPVVALTFDDGPHPKYTLDLLDILEKYGACGTFFMLGKSAQRYPFIVKTIAERGHAIGNHSWDHPSFPLLRRSNCRKQIRLCQEAISPYGCYLFRPPFGHQDWKTMLSVKRMGYKTIMWNVHGMDWLGHNSLWIADFMEPKISPGCIILLHDALHNFEDESYVDRRPTLEAVEILLQRLSGKLRFITIPDMFRLGKPQQSLKRTKGDLNWLSRLKAEADEA